MCRDFTVCIQLQNKRSFAGGVGVYIITTHLFAGVWRGIRMGGGGRFLKGGRILRILRNLYST